MGVCVGVCMCMFGCVGEFSLISCQRDLAPEPSQSNANSFVQSFILLQDLLVCSAGLQM